VGNLRELDDVPRRAVLVAGESVSEGILSVHAKQASTESEASAAVPVEVVMEVATSSDEGIPEPELVDGAGAKWRSRVLEGRWQVNTGHPDYRANSSRPALKLRYLALLFAKEIVLRSTRDPRLAEPLEQMVEVVAYADRQLTEKPPRGPRRQRSRKKS
jgi:transcriptional regulator with GAF, ATPase, and Fis domain